MEREDGKVVLLFTIYYWLFAIHFRYYLIFANVWTHIFNLMAKVLAFSLSFLAYYQVDYLQETNLLGFSFIMVLAITFYYLFFRTLGSYLYARIVLKTKLGFKQAQKLNEAFSPIWSTKWLPMHDIKKAPKDARYHMALEALKVWNAERALKNKDVRERFRNFSVANKLYNILLVVLFLAAWLLAELNLPPASYVATAYCDLFDTNTYFPELNFLVIAIPMVVIALILKKLGLKIL